MPIPFVNFKPADYHKGKESYVAFYVTNPMTGLLQRRKIKLNHIRKSTEREHFARLLCHQINEKLFAGWNPFVEEMKSASITLSQAVEKFLTVKGKSSRPATMRSYRSFCRTLLLYMDNVGLSDRFCIMVERAHLVAYLEWVENRGDFTNKTYNNYAGFLYTLFDFFCKRGFMASNPAADLPKRRTDSKYRTVIPKEDRSRILEYYTENCPSFCCVMNLCFRLFIRPKEITQLKVADVDFENRMLHIPSSVSKNHNDRVLGIPDVIFDHLVSMRDLPKSYYLFSNAKTYAPGPRQMAPTRIAEKWKAMREKLKLPASYQFYSLKDTGITEMLEAGVPAKYVKELADHHSLEMTERYTHKSNAKKILEWNRLEF